MSAALKFYADLAFTRSSISGAQKQLSSAFNSANVPLGGVKSFDHALGRLSGRASEFQKSMDAATARVFAFGAAVGVINAVAQSFKQLALATVDVEKRMTLIGSIFNRSSSTLNKFREDMFSIAKNTGQSFAVVADAATELARQGLTAEETTKRLSDALILSRISGLASADAVKTLTSAINGFNEAGFNSAQVINKLIAVDNNFAISAKDLSEALSRVGSTAQDAGVSLDELLGLVTAVQQKTQRGGAVIGNAFKTIFAKTSDFEVIEELQKLGVVINSSQTGVQKLFAISKGLEETADPAVAAKIKQLTGNIYQLNVVSAALKDISQDQSIFADATERASKASNEAYIQNDKLGKTTTASFAELVAGVTNLAAKIGEITLQPTFKAALNIANNFVEFLDKQFDPERGNKLFQLFFAGIGNFLSGPGLAIVGLAFARILQLVVKFAREGARELLSLSDVSRKNVLLQQDLVNFLAQDSKLRKLILSDATTMAQKEQLMFKAISDGNIALAQRAQIMKTLANSALVAGVAGFNPKKGFVNSRGRPGAVPNFAKEYPGLKEAILREVTGTGVKPHQVRVSQSSRFATPNNPAGMVVTNTRDEPRGVRDVPNYASPFPYKNYEDYAKAVRAASNTPFPPPAPGQSFSEWKKLYGSRAAQSLNPYTGKGLGASPLPSTPPSLPPTINKSPVSKRDQEIKKLERSTKLSGDALKSFRKDMSLVEKGVLKASVVEKKYTDAVKASKGSVTSLGALTQKSGAVGTANQNRVQKQANAARVEAARVASIEAQKKQLQANQAAVARQEAIKLATQKQVAKQASIQKSLNKVDPAPRANASFYRRKLPRPATPFISDSAVRKGQAAGGALSAAGIAAAFAVPAITGGLGKSKSDKLGVDELTKNVEKLERLLEKELKKENKDEKAIEAFEKKIEETNNSLAEAESKLKDFTGTANKVGTAFTTLAFVLPQLLLAGGKAGKAGLVGGAVAITASVAYFTGTLIYDKLGIDEKLEKRFSPDKQNDFLNTIADSDAATTANIRLLQLGHTAEKVSKILNESFSASKTTSGVTGDRATPGGRLFSNLGTGGTVSLLERARGLKDLSQEFLPENLKETKKDAASREGKTKIAAIQSDIRNVFGELAQPFRSFSDETEFATKAVEKLENAFIANFDGAEEKFRKKSIQTNLTPELIAKRRKSFLDEKLKVFSEQDPNGDGRNAILAARAKAVLDAREGLSSNEEFKKKTLGAESLIGQERTLFGLFDALQKAPPKEVEKSLLDSISSLSKTIDSQTGDGTGTKLTDLSTSVVDAWRDMYNEVLIQEKRDDLETLAKQKEIHEKFVDRLKSVFGQNVDSLGQDRFRGTKSPFQSKSITSQLQGTKSVLSNLGLSEGDVADLTSKFVNKKGFSFDDIVSSTTFSDKFKSVQASGFSPQFRDSVKEIRGEEFLKNFSNSSVSGSARGVFDFVKKGEKGGFRSPDEYRTSLVSAADQLRKLESSRSQGKLSPEKSQELDRLIAAFTAYTLEIGKRGEIFAIEGQNQKIKDTGEKQVTLAREVDSLANDTFTKALKSVETAGLSLSTSVERVTTSIMSSSDSIAASLKAAADKLNQALADIGGKPSGGPKPTTAATTVKQGG